MSEYRTNRPAEYVSVPVNFSDHIKVRPLKKQFGDNGEIFALRISCFLAQQKGFEYEYNDTSLGDIADMFDWLPSTLKKVMSFAIERNFIQIVQIDGKDYFRCEFLESVLLERLFKKRESKRSK